MRSFLVAAVVASASISGAAQAAEISSGSGVVIGTKGEILTNSHVVEACQTITVKLASGNSQLGTVVARDQRNDLAVIRLSGTDNPPASIAMFREGVPVRAGDAIVALGYPLSGLLATDANVSVGNVNALAGVADDSRYLQISAPVQPGNSGGPLLDASGHLVGIVTGKLNALRVAHFTGDIPENVNFALKAEVARTFLDSKRIEYQTARSYKQLSPADVGDLGRPFTVYIECEQVDSSLAAASPTVSPPAPPGGKGNKEQHVTGWGSRAAPGLPGGQYGTAAPTAPAPAAAPNAPAWPSQAAAPASHPPTPDDICRALEQHAAENELPVGFFARVIWQESRFNARKGAQGVANPIEALKNSARYLRVLKARFGNLGLAAAAYNAGPERVAAWLSKHQPLPGETRSYVAIITGWTADEWASANPPKTSETTIPQGVCTANLILTPKEQAQRMAAAASFFGTP